MGRRFQVCPYPGPFSCLLQTKVRGQSDILPWPLVWSFIVVLCSILNVWVYLCACAPRLTFLSKDGDDLVSRLLLLWCRRKWPRVVIGRLGVFDSSLAAHPDRGGGGLILTRSAVTHLHSPRPAESGSTNLTDIQKNPQISQTFKKCSAH